ncbi:MAG: vanadium-dependent haloperoxidase [Saprospiraceae bacterium]|nr:vanadium-dependent haloperoxidase [Saprospiraceae bacterium]
MSTTTDTYTPTAAHRWNRLACDALCYTNTPPTLAARALAIVHTAMYDAWTNFNDGGCEVSTTTGARLKRPPRECTPENRTKTYSYAAYQTLQELFWLALPPDRKNMFRDYMCELNFDPDDRSLAVSSPQGIGNLSARLVIERRLGDGANQRATLNAGLYSDFTGYLPYNPPPPQMLRDPERWQPQLQANGEPQKFLTAQFGLVEPFALSWGGQFRPPKPAGQRDAKFHEQAREVLEISANLTDEQKIIAEYWAGMHEDKHTDAVAPLIPGYWVVPPAQLARIGRYVSRKNKFKNAYDIKMFFALPNALLDAGIAAWDSKTHYDYIRPVSLLRHLYNEQEVNAWGGPCEGTKCINGDNWTPYLIGTPPFAEYVSGHSTFSAAVAEVLTAFCGNSAYGESVTIPAKSSKIEGRCTPKLELTLSWRSFHEAAEQAGMSRLYGGIHFEDGNLSGRQLGKSVGQCVWNKACQYFTGELG